MSEEYYNPISEDAQEKYQDWEKETAPRLKKEHKKEIVNINTYNLLKSLVIASFIFVAILGYAVYEGKFETEINIPNCVCPEVPSCPTIPSCPANVPCPAQTCTNECKFPDSLEIKLNNSE